MLTLSQALFGAAVVSAFAVACSAAPDDGTISSEDDVAASQGSALEKCPGLSEFDHFACPASWSSAAAPQDCECVSSRYDCMAPNPQASLDADKNRARYLNGSVGTWPIASGITVYDGRHVRIGTSQSANVLVNYGQKKMMLGRTYVLARTVTIGAGQSASGWIDSACVGWDGTTKPAPTCEGEATPTVKMPSVVARRPSKEAQGHTTAYRFLTTSPAWASQLGVDNIKVVCNTDDSHQSLGDYLPRPRDNGRVVTVHLLFTLPGQNPALSGIAGDTFIVGHEQNGAIVSDDVRFYRLTDVHGGYTRLYPTSEATLLPGHPFTPFVYGFVKYQKSTGEWVKRFGWVNYLALERVQ
ncbi:hypothetical protein BH09MYX1_BH09MYX1_62100 [soil metagenome]